MKNVIIKNDIWYDEDYYKLHLDSKILYLYLMTCPDRGYTGVFKWGKRFAAAYTGVAGDQLDIAMEELIRTGFVDSFEGYVGIKKSHVVKIGGPYGDINTEREIQRLPEDVREHFFPENQPYVTVTPTKKKPTKTGPTPETIKQIITRQPEALRETLTDFVEDRKERKKPPTTRAVKGWISKLNIMYPNDPVRQAACLQQSIERGWVGLFEVREDIKQESTFL